MSAQQYLNGKIKERLQEIGMSQNELAAKAGLSVSYLSLLLSDQRQWKLSTLERVAHALSCELYVSLKRPIRDPL